MRKNELISRYIRVLCCELRGKALARYMLKYTRAGNVFTAGHVTRNEIHRYFGPAYLFPRKSTAPGIKTIRFFS